MNRIIVPDEREIYRYLGYHGNLPDERIRQEIASCIASLNEVISPGYVFRAFPLSLMSDHQVCFAGMQIESRNLCRNLEGCEKVFLFAATLGIGPDRLIARDSISSPSRMVIDQACAAAMIEAYCNRINEELRGLAKAEQLFCRPRFSPGYGDFSLEHQKDLLRILDAAKKIGITLTDALLMVPQKSVTAVIGLSTSDARCPKSGCEACLKKDCAFRR